ncbi:VIT1/CCC1 transporter family protein [Companilactobacillus ginsenosidimutans]|uniref:Membrane protein n=1 Tax=Companilactobacillus ginsenosidimutans TaxID=1007676 RepID=A0A0H4QD52_9LACO|nr:VIT family protein [Companilactobacillus ginsenosidimutans]AKP66264.1 membrane protein [Companilactobacillus ginsenosidimutans]
MKTFSTSEDQSLSQRLIQKFHLSEQLNIIRAGVLGANDGIVSVAGIVIGVAGAQQSTAALFIAGISGMFAGALSMGGGEYVSVSTQRDTQKTMTRMQDESIQRNYEGELNGLAHHYESEGLTPALAKKVAVQLMENDALNVTLKSKCNIELQHYFNPWHAAISSFLSFILGSLLPLLSITFIPYPYKVPGTIAAVICALTFTGYASATLGNSDRIKGVLRNLLVGIGTMTVTYLIGGSLG